jgi:S1-C subfamily serine protease
MNSRQATRVVLQGLVMMTLSVVACASPKFPTDHFQLGWQAYEAGQYDAALSHWLPLADQGNTDAQLNVGLMYDVGKGVPEDPARAVSWYRQSAERGHAAAQFNLGLMYASGRGVEQDTGQARFWLAQAAGQGLQEARAMLPNVAEQSSIVAASAAAPDRPGFFDALSGSSTGTAWPVAENYAVTSNHVVEGADVVTLYDAAGLPLRATVVLRDTGNDIAVLRTSDADSLPPPLPLSHAAGRLGSDVFTLGFPRVDILGRTPKLAEGIISSVNGYRDDPASYQTSVQIQPGNSGGPLLNMEGEVVGIVASMLGIVRDSAEPVIVPSISYAVKIEVLHSLLASLPEPAGVTDTRPGASAPLADLAARIQPSVLMVVVAD